MIGTNSSFLSLSVDFNSLGDYFLFIFHVTAGISTVLVAGSVVCGIIANRTLFTQHRFIFMLNTSISDTLTGCGIFYQFLFDVEVGFNTLSWAFYIIPTLLGVNILTFLFAQFDRYFAVCHPYIYGRFITTKVVICVNAYSWVHMYCQGLLQHLLPRSKLSHMVIYIRMSIFVIIFIKVSLTVKLFFVARYQLLREPPGPERDSKKESLLVIIVVVLFFLLFWCPSMLYTIVVTLIRKHVFFRNDAYNPMKILSRTNALCTPSLYLWASPSLRAAVWKTVWSKICCRKTNTRLVTLL
ncbi:mu-type opioid receptor-like [Cyprinodon tularosa]|uniref:mu-type opioid receptor-like n=1 Tax=Cyprinodon tularosa TaxID=77115 RepID=UPI0018E20002|nr:mu-type opioid receptor-like [Cyprinodon tularosa]